MGLLGIVAAAVVSIAAAVVLAFYLGQRALLYPAPHGYAPPAAVGLADFAEDPLTADDGTTVMVWSHPAAPDRPTVLHLHGNGDSLPGLADQLAAWSADGWGVCALTYRGYPGSGGAPTEDALVADAIAAFDRLVARGVPAADIVLSGYSLGSAIAVAVAAERPAAALFLVGAMSSIEDVAKAHYPWLPVRTLMKDRFPSAERAARVQAPAVLVHGADDRVVPLRFAKRLFAHLPEPKRLTVVPDGGHILPPATGWDAFVTFWRERGRDGPAPGAD